MEMGKDCTLLNSSVISPLLSAVRIFPADQSVHAAGYKNIDKWRGEEETAKPGKKVISRDVT